MTFAKTANKNPIARFAALVHDIGKGGTPPEMLPHHYRHELRGLKIFEKMCVRLNMPGNWRKFSRIVIAEHMRAPLMTKPGKIVNLLLHLNKSKINVKDFCDVIRADHGTLPPHLEKAEEIIFELLKVDGRSVPKELYGEDVGKKILENRIRRFTEMKF